MELMDYKVDVIIPTYRPNEKTVMLIQRLLKQVYPIHEIHVVDTETEVFPQEMYNLSEKVRITRIQEAEFDHGGTRRKAAEESEADILVFMTQDALPIDVRLLSELLKPFEDERVGAVYARQLADKTSDEIERYTRNFNYPKESAVKSYEDIEKIGIKTFFCSNVCAAYRKEVYDSLGGFEKKTIFNEDSIMAAKMIEAGYYIVYAANARVIHSHNYNCRQQFKRNFDLAVSQAEHPEIFSKVSSENEGKRLVKETAKYLLKKGKPWLVFSLVTKSGAKYAGYLLGKNYKKLPKGLVLKFTSNKNYW